MTTAEIVIAWMAVWERRMAALERYDQAWRNGWNAAQIHAQARYEQGFADGCLALKKAQHDAHALTQAEITRWGPGGRGHFADARPGDYAGGSVKPW